MSNFGYRSTALEVVNGINLSDKNAIVTGGYSGIGIETVIALASAGANVTIACRDLPRAEDVVNELNNRGLLGTVDAQLLDLGSLQSVKNFTDSYRASHTSLEILINNAGVMACPSDTTIDGFERQFGTNHLGHYALSRLLLPLLLNAEYARVVCLSSTGHMISPVVFDDINFNQRAYDAWSSYGQAKTANSLTAVALQQLYGSKGIDAFAVHPGGIMTSLQRHMDKEDIEARGWVDAEGNVNERFKTVEQGASTSTWAATSAQLTGKGGVYLEDCDVAEVVASRPEFPKGVIAYAVDADAAKQLWQVSESMIVDKFPDYFE
jgi:NAD(P)-dependent dehydrogenase (short-subunit alcohol dehydrogenase family)